ncbi:hypothetical protein PpBr36_09015 [Pyricularia pennisetigena]|uniref:hypothetical protein n=1 Tax=Pyricularia pennisetigena TaxID=1578925 RepID=UPI0011547148|nr:hypothetical protein PpBr36_09015 [Pyricularia pennisetigena]TLS24153.1 hypothetical protein PpBr36_09015 [Pyricularia pennisetigena]
MDDTADDHNPGGEASTATPALPPSVEEAYRRKCIQLKQRTAEVEEANEASRIRLSRLSRQAEKMRIERAFLLEQLAKRTSTNVEDSDGSPSPPPTPKEKPLRTKRGHRKLSTMPGTEAGAATPGSSFANPPEPVRAGSSQLPASPTSDASPAANGTGAKKPSSAFDVYCAEIRPTVAEKEKDKDSVEEELARRWKDLSDADKEPYKTKYEKLQKEAEEKQQQKDKKSAADKTTAAAESEKAADVKAESSQPPEDTPGPAAKTGAAQDEDVEMTNYDTEPEATPSAAGGDAKN